MGGGGGAGGGRLLGIFADIDCGKSFSIQGISLLDKPVCQSSVFASFANNAPMVKQGQQSFIQKFAASMREDFAKMARDAGVMYNGPVTAGSPVSSGAPAASGGDISLA